jgi:ABC-type multidrug transport system fused ATPase/permease subunit
VVIAMCGVVWLAQRSMRGEISPQEFLYMGLLMAAVFDPIRRVSTIFTRMQRADAACARIFEIIDMPAEERNGLAGRVLPPLRGEIEFRDVTFTYPGQQVPALAEINLTVTAGQRVAIVGPNGSGKTTLIGLLLRFFEPGAGAILVDGTDIATASIRSLRGQVSLVTQEAIVFAMSARDNIGYGLAGATEEQIVEAARKAHADEFIERMPDGYDTVIGESGATLSGGERQRLSLARAIIRDAPIFIFDEATSQIDVDSEQKIHQAMVEFMRGRTSLVIAHRIATISDADQIVVLDRGRIEDQGTHDELLTRCELYKTLYYTHLAGAPA